MRAVCQLPRPLPVATVLARGPPRFAEQGPYPFDSTCHAESNATDSSTFPRHSLEDRLAQTTRALAGADTEEFTMASAVEKAGRAEFERNLAAVQTIEFESKNTCSEVASDHGAFVIDLRMR